MFRKLAVSFALMFVASPPLAAQTLIVESLVSPAWLERGGVRKPLVAGALLRNKDKVHTSKRASAA